MNRVLSFPQAHTCEDPAEAVSKRFCFSCIISVSFLALIIGYLMGSKRSTVNNMFVKSNDEYMKTLRTMLANEKYQPLETSSLLRYDNKVSTVLQHFITHKFDRVFPITKSNLVLTFKNDQVPDSVNILNDGGLIYESVVINITTAYSVPAHVDKVYYIENHVLGTPVYGNFGSEEDIEFLIEKGISIENHILLLRKGEIPIVDTVKDVRKRGAKGILFFSDSEQYLKSDCGIPTNDLHPVFLTELQQVIFSYHKGDFVVLYIDIATAKKILSEISNTIRSPDSWHGLLNVSYSVGPGFMNKHWKLSLKSNFVEVQYIANDIIASLRGTHEPDRYVVISASRKSLLKEKNTMNDMEIFFEVSKILAEMKSQRNWSPYRSLVFINFDLDDMDMSLNSWIQKHIDIVQQRTVAHLKIGQVKKIENEKSSVVRKLLSDIVSIMQNSSDVNFTNPEFQSLLESFEKPTSSKIPCLDSIDEFYSKYDGTYPLVDIPTASSSFLHEELIRSNISIKKENLVTIWALLGFSLSTKSILPFNFTNYLLVIENYNDLLKSQTTGPKNNLIKELDNFRSSIKQAIENIRGFPEGSKSNLEKVDSSRIINDRQMQIEKLFHCVLSTYKFINKYYPNFPFQNNHVLKKGQNCIEQIVFLIDDVGS